MERTGPLPRFDLVQVLNGEHLHLIPALADAGSDPELEILCLDPTLIVARLSEAVVLSQIVGSIYHQVARMVCRDCLDAALAATVFAHDVSPDNLFASGAS